MVRAARADERARIVALLARAFAHDPLADWLLRTGDGRPRALHRYMDTALRRCAMSGGRVEVTDDLAGAALWTDPGRWHQPLWREATLAPRLLPHVRLSPAVLRGLLIMEEAHPRSPHHYLFVIGVDPARHGEGIGGRLLAARLAEVDRAGEAAYLEASSPASARLYARHGFEATGELRMPAGGPTLWPMWRHPREAS